MGKQDIDFTDKGLNFSYDVRRSRFFTKNRDNYINIVSPEQLPTMGREFLLDVFLSAGNMVEPHYHINASELIYCITGETVVSMINPTTNELKSFKIKPQQVVTIPQGWWHYFSASRDNTHVLTIYDTSDLHTVWGSDILRLTPPEVFAHAYCLNENKVKEALAPIKNRVIIGPPENCRQHASEHRSEEETYYPPQLPPNPYNPYYTRPVQSPYSEFQFDNF